MLNDIIRVVLADDHAVVRAGLKAVLGTAKDIQVIGEICGVAAALALRNGVQPRAVHSHRIAGRDARGGVRQRGARRGRAASLRGRSR